MIEAIVERYEMQEEVGAGEYRPVIILDRQQGETSE
jgi:hypothetical protein